MHTFTQAHSTTMRQCEYCGKFVPSYRTQCPNCRETLGEIPAAHRPYPRKRGEIRRGLLYMLMSAVIYYFASGNSAMNLPFPISPRVTDYLAPLLFLAGLGLVVHGFYLRRRR